MSTKSSIAHGSNFHLYHEVFDNEMVYLELEKAIFEACPDRVTVGIPVVVWEVIRQMPGADLSWAAKSDEEIRSYVEKEVGKRIAINQGENSKMKAFLGFHNRLFGDVNTPKAEQIACGVAHYSKVRGEQRDMLMQINDLLAKNL